MIVETLRQKVRVKQMSKLRDGWTTDRETMNVPEKFARDTIKVLSDEGWKPHPLVKEILLNVVIEKKDNDAGVTCLFVRIPRGKEIPEHVHELSNDIIVPLKGKARIWIKGIGDFEMSKGVIINIPQGVTHKVFEVTEDFLAFDVFSPGIV